MEPDFKGACQAIEPYFDVFMNKFINEMKDVLFVGNEHDFTKAKTKVEFLQQMKQTILNECNEEKV